MKNVLLEAEFGWIKVNGVKYEKDIVIHSDGLVTKREKKKSKYLKPDYGHTPLSEWELEFILSEKFDALYVGTGHEGALPITAKALEVLKKNDAVILPTSEIVSRIEQEKRRFVALIHITC